MEPSDSSNKTEQLKTAMLKERRVSRFAALEKLLHAFSPGERLALYALAILLGGSTFVLLAGLNSAISVIVPASGGSLTEGEVGPVRFVNPVLTLSQADEDLTALVYSGLMRTLPGGSVIPDLAESYETSSDGTTYIFTLRQDAKFQDGTVVTSADVLFTVQEAQNPDIKSPHRADWEGVLVSAPNTRTVVFKLPHAYAPFIQNTTLGILPSHLWKNVSAEEFPFSPINTHPVGSGPYKISDVTTDSTGSITRYELVPFNGFLLGTPYIRHLTFVFYPSESALLQALEERRVDAVAGISPQELSGIKRGGLIVMTSPLPRVFGVFFNQSHAPVLADTSARMALNAAIDKERLVDSVLNGYGVPLDSPIPPGIIGPALAHAAPTSTSTPAYTDETLSNAREILTRGGWIHDSASGTWTKKPAKSGSTSGGKQILSFTLTTADAPELVATAQAIADAWKKLGVGVTVHMYSLSELNTTVIRPRQYDAILFGEVVGRELDLFAFWHSSQRNDPGLNLALYTNSKADALLSQARATTNPQDREKLYVQFTAFLQKDEPAVFLYAPEFIYVVPTGLGGVRLGALTTPSERFLNVYRWYTETQHVWNFFTGNSN